MHPITQRKKSKGYYFAIRIDHRLVSIFESKDATFPAGNSSPDHTFRFIKYNCQNLSPFLDKLVGRALDPNAPQIASIVDLTKRVHEEDRRKVTGDLYIKHLFYTAYLADEMTREKRYSQNKKKLLLATAFLHDTIELKRKRRETEDYAPKNLYFLLKDANLNGMTARDIKKIVTIVALMTPKDKPSDMPVPEWRDIKREDFNKLINITREEVIDMAGLLGDLDGIRITDMEASDMAEIIRDVKVAEVMANLRETADDIIWGREAKDGIPNMKNFNDRYAVFQERVTVLQDLPISIKYKEQMREDMEYLSEFIRD